MCIVPSRTQSVTSQNATVIYFSLSQWTRPARRKKVVKFYIDRRVQCYVHYWCVLAEKTKATHATAMIMHASSSPTSSHWPQPGRRSTSSLSFCFHTKYMILSTSFAVVSVLLHIIYYMKYTSLWKSDEQKQLDRLGTGCRMILKTDLKRDKATRSCEHYNESWKFSD